MLDRLRAIFPHVQSLLMDRETLLAHRRLWVREENPHAGALVHLTSAERSVYEGLKGARLEQERIPYGWVMKALAAACGGR